MTRTVITGTAAGLGQALSKAARNRGHEVIGVDISPGQGIDIACDLTNPQAPSLIAAEMGGPCDLLIHCAGISATGPFEKIPAPSHSKVIALNLTAPIVLTSHLMKAGLLKDQVAFVASLSVFSGYPGAVSYAASKDGLAAFARSLPAPLRASTIYPGPLNTQHARRYAPDNTQQTVDRRLDPDQAAKMILRDLSRGKRHIIPGRSAQAIAWAARFAPGIVENMLVKSLFAQMEDVRD